MEGFISRMPSQGRRCIARVEAKSTVATLYDITTSLPEQHHAIQQRHRSSCVSPTAPSRCHSQSRCAFQRRCWTATARLASTLSQFVDKLRPVYGHDLDRADRSPSKVPGMTCSKDRLLDGICQVSSPAAGCHTTRLLSEPTANDEMRRWLAQQRIGVPARMHRRWRPKGSLDHAKLADSLPLELPEAAQASCCAACATWQRESRQTNCCSACGDLV
jgi:hypothetical protein